MEKVVQNASTLREALTTRNGLTLWEAGAILNEPRDATLGVLFWMAGRRQVACSLKDQQLYVTLAPGGEDGTGRAGSP
jgi:hypothetical protein